MEKAQNRDRISEVLIIFNVFTFNVPFFVCLIAKMNRHLDDDYFIKLLETYDDDLLDFLRDESENYKEPTYSSEMPAFDAESCTESQAKEYFRFSMEEIDLLADLLGLPEIVRLPNRCVMSRRMALCCMLRRLAYPNRLSDLEKRI